MHPATPHWHQGPRYSLDCVFLHVWADFLGLGILWLQMFQCSMHTLGVKRTPIPCLIRLLSRQKPSQKVLEHLNFMGQTQLEELGRINNSLVDHLKIIMIKPRVEWTTS